MIKGRLIFFWALLLYMTGSLAFYAPGDYALTILFALILGVPLAVISWRTWL